LTERKEEARRKESLLYHLVLEIRDEARVQERIELSVSRNG
jgi:hypothetical protein